jgi:Mg-chelatase subunit ChlI
MIGRDRELRQLARLARSRQPAVVFLAGEPGIGKTRMVRELIASLGPQTRVLVGYAEPDSLARPYELLLDALASSDEDRPVPVAEPDLLALTDAGRSAVERLHTALAIVAKVVESGL